MPDTNSTRRRYLTAVAALTATVAGCSSTNDTSSTTQETPSQNTGTTTTQPPTDTTQEQPDTESTGKGGGGKPPRPDYNGWLNTAATDAETVAAYGETEVTVTIEKSDGSYRLSPTAVQVDLGATITWEVKTDTAHKIAAEDNTFSSKRLVSPDNTFQYTFTEPGIYPYACLPHKALGEVGAVVVGTDYPTVLPDAPLAWYTNTYDSFTLPLAANDAVYVTSGEKLYAFNPTDGSERWQRPFDGHSIKLTSTASTLYASTYSGHLAAINPSDGTDNWTRQTTTHLFSYPEVAESGIYVSGERGLIHAFAEDGTKQWQRELPSDYLFGLASDSDAVYTAGGVRGRGSLYRLNPGTGETEWEYSTETVNTGLHTPVIHDGTVITGGLRGDIHAIDAASGGQRWRVETDTGLDRAPTVDDNTVYARRTGQELVAITIDDGSIAWRFNADGGLQSHLIATNDTVYAATDTTIYAIDATSGEPQTRYNAGDTVYWTRATHDSQAVVADWGVWAIDTTTPPNQNSSTPPSLPVTIDGTTIAGDWGQGVFVTTS